MSRHIIDRPTGSAGVSMKAAFLKLDRQKRIHQSVHTLSRQAKNRTPDGRLRQFVRIDRGKEA